MTPASIVLAAAVAAWGPVAPAPLPRADVEQVAPAAPADTAVEPVAPVAPPPLPARPVTIQSPMLAKAPLDVRGTPALMLAPRDAREPPVPLYKRWGFWVIAGGIFASTIFVTIVVTRPKPDPYTGNAPPYHFGFP